VELRPTGELDPTGLIFPPGAEVDARAYANICDLSPRPATSS